MSSVFRTLHPASWIVFWAMLVMAIQRLESGPLALVLFLCVLSALNWSRARLAILLSRTRWLLLVLLLVYGYTHGGGAVWPGLGNLSPSVEGLGLGLQQLSRLLAILASLSLLLQKMDRAEWLVGLYVLLAPLQVLPGMRERMTARLALTLEYAETGWGRGAAEKMASISRYQALDEVSDRVLHLKDMRISNFDRLLMFACAAAVMLECLL